jgi:hypothetical protein
MRSRKRALRAEDKAMLLETDYIVLAAFVTGTLDEPGWRTLAAEARQRPELMAAICDLAPVRAALTDDQMRRANLEGLSSPPEVDDLEHVDLDPQWHPPDDTDDDEQIEELLRRYWPAACALAGPALVSDVIAGGVDFASPRYGALIDASHPVEVVSRAVDFLRRCLSRYASLRDSLQRQPTATEVRDATSGDARSLSIDSERHMAIAADLCARDVDE